MTEFISSFTSLPNLHPLLVHYPVAFFTVAIAFDFLCLLFRRQTWLDRTTIVTYLVGAMGVVATYFAGEQAADSLVGVPPKVEPLIAEHSDWGLYTLLFFLVFVSFRVFVYWRERNSSEIKISPLRLLAIVAAIAGQWILFQAADRGGALVYQHGMAVTITAAEEPAPQNETQADSGKKEEPEKRLITAADGVLIWQPIPQDASALGKILTIADSGPNSTVSASSPVPGQEGLGLNITGRTLLLLPGTFGNVYLDAELDLSNFDGTVGLAHHAKNLSNAELFEITRDRKAALISITDGKQEGLGKGVIDSQSALKVLSVSASGSHLKGLVDGVVVVHGHKPAPEPAGVGLLLDGQGIVVIIKMKVTPL